MIVNELILKVSSICNLNCKYCYVYNKGDNSYKEQPKLMNENIMIHTIERIKEHCNRHQLKDFLVIFHGGEPLLANKDFYVNFVNYVKRNITEVNIQLALQTNGTLLTQEWYSLLNNLNISIGVSLDGTYKASENRIYKATGQSAYNEIIRGVDLLHKNQYPVRVLNVINIQETPQNIYNHLKSKYISYVDFLLPDMTYNNMKKYPDGLIGDWLINMFELWYNDNSSNKPMIRIFDIIIGLIIGVERGNEQLGRRFNQCICVKPNGDIQPVDNMMVCGDGFTKTEFNVINNSLDEAINNNEILKKYYNSHQDSELCEKCKKCIIKHICGGGHLAHRYSSANVFDNPSVYCNDISTLIMHIQNKLVKDLAIPDINLEKLTLHDFK